MKISRKQFIQCLIGAPALLRGANAAASVDKLKDGDQYKGYTMHWTGFKGCPEKTLLCGQWVAWNPHRKGIHLYACTTGTGGPIHEGELFDVSVKSPKNMLHYWDPEEQQHILKVETLERLITLIHKHPLRGLS